MSKNITHLSARKGLDNNLFDRFGQLVQDSGTINKEELEALCDEFLIGTSSAYGTITSYDFLKPENQNKKIYLCNGSACLCAGTQGSLKEKIMMHFTEEEMGEMCCLGRCHENHAFHYNGVNYSGSSVERIEDILSGNNNEREVYEVKSLGKSLLSDEINDTQGYYKPLEAVLNEHPDSVIDTIVNSGLRGRGGAGFPMGMKLKFCREAAGDVKFIICNADEGDPGAYSDRFLLEQRPHAVLFGMLVAGYCTGSQYGVLYIRGEYPESVTAIEEAVDFLKHNNLCGDRILGHDFSFNFKIIKAQGSYICGEETALINSIEGQRPEVRTRPPYPATYGLFGKPTTVSNVETLASLHYIIENGGKAFAEIGTETSSGTKLLSLDSHFNHPGVYEVEMGTPLLELINAAGGFKQDIKALHIGGPLGGLVPLSKAKNLDLDFESFSSQGFLLGHASIICIPHSMPMIKYLQHLFAFAAHESCGKCFPCRLGTKRAEEMIKKSIVEDEYKMDKKLFDDLLFTLEEGSLCAHGGGIPLPVRNALHYFKEELSNYFSEN